MGDVDEWLERLGLSQYRAVFAEHDIDREILPDLTDQDLEKLGLSLGHRKKLLRAIAELARPDSEAQREAEAAPRAAERRQLTVLFCDLVGSTELAARLDPEDMGGVIRAYQARCAEVVERWGGHVAKYMGDGVLAYFGWPQAHEDEAERAVRAGLASGRGGERPDAPALPGRRARRLPLAARVGIATGLVSGRRTDRRRRGAGADGGRRDAEPGGATAGAGRAGQRGDQPGDAAAARRPVRARRPRAAAAQGLRRAARGVAGRGRGPGRRALRGAPDRGLTPLVGRDEEIALLLRRWQQAKDGEGHVVLLSGEPGIGKSRLVREVRARLADEPHVRLLYQCSPHHTTSPLHPLIEQLERAAGFERDEPPAAQARQARDAAGARYEPARPGGAADRGAARRCRRQVATRRSI